MVSAKKGQVNIHAAIREKLYSAEHHIAWARFVMILFNSLIYTFLYTDNKGIPWLAWTIIIVANAYSVYLVAFKPYRQYSVLLTSYFTTSTDTALITLWIMATGFAGSPFYLIWNISVIAVAMRYSIKETIIATLVYITAYAVVIVFDADDVLTPFEIATRMGYIPIAALLGIYFSRELIDQINDKIKTRETEAELKLAYDQLEIRVKERTSELQEKNNDITASINYAHHIQNAILPNMKEISERFSDVFVLYLPKDIISGDFYWYNHKHNEKTCFIAAVDCTGHGVPGALMSIMGADLLNQYVGEGEYDEPAEILYELDNRVARTLKQKSLSTIVNDGMEMALCKFFYSENENKMVYAGANLPVYLIRDGKLTIYEGSKKSIGGHRYYEDKLFKQIEIDIKDGDRIFLFSDGYIDQFGGEQNKKMMKKRFQKILVNNSHLPMDQQKKALHLELIKWQGINKQVDDILIIGLQI